MRNITILLCAALAACRPAGEAAEDATVAIMQEVRAGTPLDDMLQMLDDHLVQAMDGGADVSAIDAFGRAEAITDRLLEARVPFEWLTGDQYSLQSRLRQIQSSADRVLAQIQTGVLPDTVMLNLRELRADVVRLRAEIATGGTRAPPPIDRLLAGDTTEVGLEAIIAAPVAAPVDTVPRPLGSPVTTGGL